MEKEKILSTGKTLKWLSVVLGVVLLLGAAIALFFKTEDPSTKTNVLLFAILGAIGVATMLFGMAIAGLYEAVGAIEKKNDADDDVDILA